MAIDLGDVYRLNYTNLSAAGAPVSADQVTVTVTLPDGTSLSPVVVAPTSTGVYLYDYPTTQAGRHIARWVATGAGAGATADAFDVRPANPGYLVSLEDVKKQLNMTATTDDEELRRFLEAATQVVERHVGRAVVRREITEERLADGCLILNWPPVLSVSSVSRVDGSATWAPADLHTTSSGIVRSLNGVALTGLVAATYTAGMAIIPANYALAAMIIVQHLWQTQRGTAGSPGVGGLETPGAGFTSFGYAIPNRAMELLGPSMPNMA